MAKRVLVGDRTTGGYGLYVSKPGSDVTNCSLGDLTFWTDSSETGSNFVAKGTHQICPVEFNQQTSAPVEQVAINLSQNASAAVSFEGIVNDSGDIMCRGGAAHVTASSGSGSQRGIKFTNISSSGATASRTYSSTGGTFVGCIFKLLGGGATLY